MTMIRYLHGKQEKTLFISTICENQWQSIIIGAIVAFEGLKRPCTVHLYTQLNFGFEYMKNRDKKWGNRDYGNQLHETLVKGRHMVYFHDCSKEGQQLNLIQRQMDKQLKAYFKKATTYSKDQKER